MLIKIEKRLKKSNKRKESSIFPILNSQIIVSSIQFFIMISIYFIYGCASSDQLNKDSIQEDLISIDQYNEDYSNENDLNQDLEIFADNDVYNDFVDIENIGCNPDSCLTTCIERGFVGGSCIEEICQCTGCPDSTSLTGKAAKTLLKSESGGTLYKLTPPAGGEKDSIIMASLHGTPYEIGYQHSVLLADKIADVITNRYYCPEITEEMLNWTVAAYENMPDEFKEEIQGIIDGMRDKGYTFDVGRIILHATQPLTPTPAAFPWFICPWQERETPGGSFSYAVWGNYVEGGGTLTIGSPDWGHVPRSLARNRVLFSIEPASGYKHVFLGVAGTIGLTGMNQSGLSVHGTAGQRCTIPRTPMPGNGIAIPDGFMTLFMQSRFILTHFSASDPAIFEKIEREILLPNPIDGFIAQISTPGRSALWEPGATASPDYPFNSRREAGEWDNGSIMPISISGDFVISQYGVSRIEDLSDYTIEYYDSAGNPYSGTAVINGNLVHWRNWRVGIGIHLPADPMRDEIFSSWASKIGSNEIRSVPSIFSSFERSINNPIFASSQSDGLSGFWTDGVTWGRWWRDGNRFHAVDEFNNEICTGPLYDFGSGVTGWCNMGSTDMEVLAWKFNFPGGAYERLDGMNLSVLPEVKQWALVGLENGFWDIGPHPRTHFVLQYLGVPQSTLTLLDLYYVFLKAYLTIGGETASFGVGTYDLVNLNALFTVSRYEGDNFIGGLHPQQIPVLLDCKMLFEE